MTDLLTAQKTRASKWFEQLRNDICTAFEALEDAQNKNQPSTPPGRFELTRTHREKITEGGGLMSVMRGGRIFEKVGVNFSTVHGVLSPKASKAMSERRDVDLGNECPFWASGISLVAHMNSPKCPAVHMNTRMFWTPKGYWFGGGSDLNPMVEIAEDTAFFHATLKTACDKHDPTYYPKFKKWADEYFMIKHRKQARGVGGVFFDDLNTGDWDADFSFTQDIGRAFLKAFLPITEKYKDESWTDAEREHQLQKRGLYAEFNLIYDRGTQFGLQTGHNVEAVLMSMPPVAKWY